MHQPLLAPRPLSGPGLQLSLLLFVFTLMAFLGPPPDHGRSYGSGRPVLLPFHPGPDHLPDSDSSLVISLRADGYAFIGHKWYPASELLTGINTHLAQTAQSRVVLRIDRSIRFQSIRALLRILQSARIRSVFLVTYEGYAGDPSIPVSLFLRDAT